MTSGNVEAPATASVAKRVGRQRLVHPIRHGASVELPVVDFEQGRLFEGGRRKEEDPHPGPLPKGE